MGGNMDSRGVADEGRKQTTSVGEGRWKPLKGIAAGTHT
jgi:hypothetical protein